MLCYAMLSLPLVCFGLLYFAVLGPLSSGFPLRWNAETVPGQSPRLAKPDERYTPH